MRRFAWFLILAVLLKLSMGMAVSAPLHSSLPASPMPACHEQGGHDHRSDSLDSATSATANAASACSPLDDCHHCCAVGLGMYVLMVAHQLPSAAPMRAWTHGTSLCPRPDLRPPIA